MNMQGWELQGAEARGGVWEGRSCGWPGPSLSQGDTRSLRPGPGPCTRERGRTVSPLRGWGWEWRVSPPWASPRARSWGARRLKEKGPWPSSLQSSRQEGESRRCPRALGSGRGVGRSPPPPALPLPKLRALSPPMIRTGRGGGSAFRPRDSGRWPRATPLRPLSSRGGRRRPAPGSQSASGGAGSGRWDPAPAPRLRRLRPLLRLRGRRALRKRRRVSPRPRNPARRAGVREWARATPPAGARGAERRRAAAVLGRPAFGRRRVGRARSRGRQFPRSSPPFPDQDGAAGPRAAATSPRPVSEEDFRPQPRWLSGPALRD